MLALAIAMGGLVWQLVPERPAQAKAEVDMVAQSLTMADANGDGQLQLDEHLALSFLALFRSRHLDGVWDAKQDPHEVVHHLLPARFREEGMRLLAAKHRHALAVQRAFHEVDLDHNGALNPEELRHLLGRQKALDALRYAQAGPPRHMAPGYVPPWSHRRVVAVPQP